MRTDFGRNFDRKSRSGPVLTAASRTFVPRHRILRLPQAPLLRIEQPPANQVQIGERRGNLESVQILRQTSVANLAEAKDVLDHTEDMLHFGSHSRLVAVLCLLNLIDLAVKTIALVGEVLRSRRMPVDEVSMALITLVAPDPRLGAVQQVGQRVSVLHIGGRGEYRVDELRFAVHSDVRLQSGKDTALPPCPPLRTVH